MNYNKLLIIIFILFSFALKAQEVSNVRFEQEGKQIYIYYDLEGKNGTSFSINIFYSIDYGYGRSWKKLKEITGDVGVKVKCGRKKKAVWNVLDELEGLEGKVEFKITATLNHKEKRKKSRFNKGTNNIVVARNWVGVKGGVNFSQAKFSNFTNGFNNNPTGYNFGFVFKSDSKKVLGFQLEILFDRYYIKMLNMEDLKVSNISFPLLATFNFGKSKYRPIFLIGLPINLTMSNYDDYLNSFIGWDFSLITGAGLNLYLNNRKALYIEIRYSYGLTELLNEDYRIVKYGSSLKRNSISINFAYIVGK